MGHLPVSRAHGIAMMSMCGTRIRRTLFVGVPMTTVLAVLANHKLPVNQRWNRLFSV
jgi:hypothetical protein